MPILPMPQFNFDYPVTIQSMSSHAADLSAWGQRGWARVAELESCLDIIINLRDSEESRIARTYRR